MRTLAATGCRLTPTSIEEEGRVVYDLRDGNRLEVRLSTGSRAYQVTRAPGDDDGLDHYDHTRAWTSALDPRSQREMLDHTLSACVFAEHLHRNGSGLGEMSYAGAETTANADGEIIDLPVHDSQEQLSVIRSGGRTSVPVLDGNGVDLNHCPDQYAEALQRITGRPDAGPAQIAASIGAAADEVSRIRTESPDCSALRDRPTPTALAARPRFSGGGAAHIRFPCCCPRWLLGCWVVSATEVVRQPQWGYDIFGGWVTIRRSSADRPGRPFYAEGTAWSVSSSGWCAIRGRGSARHLIGSLPVHAAGMCRRGRAGVGVDIVVHDDRA